MIIQETIPPQHCRLTILVFLNPKLTHFATWLEGLLEQKSQYPIEIFLLDTAIHSRLTEVESICQKYHTYLDGFLANKTYSFHYLKFPHYLDQYASFNEGLRLMQGDWVYLCHSDQRFLPNAFRRFEAIVHVYFDLALMTCQFYRLNESDEILEKSPQLTHLGLVNESFLQQVLLNDTLPLNAVFWHRHLFQKIGYFNTHLKNVAPWELLRRASKLQKIQWYYLPEYLVCDRLTELQTLPTRDLAQKQLWAMLKLGDKYCTASEQRQTKKAQYLRLFTLANQLLETQDIAPLCSLMADIVKYSDLGDRLWLEVLNQADFSHKQELYNFIVSFAQKPYLHTLA